MSLLNSRIYIEDLKQACESTVDFKQLKNKSIMITGASGLIGSFIVDTLMYSNEKMNMNVTIYALGRSKKRLEDRFSEYKNNDLFHIVEQDVNEKIDFNFEVDFIIHAASNAYPAAFNTDPVGTILSNVCGTDNLLRYGSSKNAKRFLFVSSGEVYGQCTDDIEEFHESYSGYVDPTKARSCYPASKRTAETLCISYTKQYGLDTVIVRPCHCYGPNVTKSDNRASVQFINNGLQNKDIILKSAGRQLRSYCYIADCVSALLTVLIKGNSCEAYNIANPEVKVTVSEYAQIVAEMCGRKVLYEQPDAVAKQEQTPIEKQVLCADKLEALGWKGCYSINQGIENTLEILREI